ncbi:hypothetical protein GCM10010512_45830 [Streptomyces thermoviolaceus subsp. thermoviolaceus]|nr:hypothetical protein GCM10010512_45830 [Streptomyces thermoviolaceus subsp. thermoviolaceus]
MRPVTPFMAIRTVLRVTSVPPYAVARRTGPASGRGATGQQALSIEAIANLSAVAGTRVRADRAVRPSDRRPGHPWSGRR